jgi:predicted transglutaminase-like cysteine proteinase
MKFLLPFIFLATTAYAEPHLPTRGPADMPVGAVDLCIRYDWVCATYEGRPATRREVQRINRTVNRVPPIADLVQHGVYEHWSVLSKKGGDCEDYALTKKHRLVMLGVDPKTLLVTVVLDKKRQPHAVLVWRTEQGDFVLDNLTNRIVPWNKTGYFFIMMQDPNQYGKWLTVLK